MSWQVERIYQDPAPIFRALLESLAAARQSIDFEMFIFERGKLGDEILNALKAAAARGVSVRLLVDGVGSPQFDAELIAELSRAHVRTRVYRPWSVFFRNVGRALLSFQFRSVFRETANMNRRNHRKVCIIDGRAAWVGSANVSDRHQGWRETVVYVEGEGVRQIETSFLWIWERARTGRSASSRDFPIGGPFVNVSFGIQTRRRNDRFRRVKIDEARHHIRLVSPYFIPPFQFLMPLLRAVRRGVRVEILLPLSSDWPILIWLARSYYEPLLALGARIFEYRRGMLHSKILIVDDAAIIGSSNYNFRSFLHDMEIDVLVSHPQTLAELDRQWERDLHEAKRVEVRALPSLGWLSALFVRIFSRFKQNF